MNGPAPDIWDEIPPIESYEQLTDRVDPPRFRLERWAEIEFEPRQEWLIKRVLPRRGLAAIYGKPGSFKSFIALHIVLCVALGRPWAGRRVVQGSVVYIAAEGAAGLRKRKAGYVKAWDDLPTDIDFALVSAAPNLGTDPGDLPALIAAVERAGIEPVAIVVDTVAKTIGAADENGSGMTAFIGNAGALAQHFDCLVLAVHHVGLGEDAQRRMRGHSSFHGALDAQILCDRREGENATTLTLQKLKDDASEVRLTASLTRVVVGLDEDDEEASTLIVNDVTEADAPAATPRAPKVPPQQRLLNDIVVLALDEVGENMSPFGGEGPTVRAVFDETVRERYYAAIAEKAAPGDDPDKVAERQRRAFNRAVADMLKAKRLVAREVRGRRMLWLS
jgi:RecA/RadA recombinase